MDYRKRAQAIADAEPIGGKSTTPAWIAIGFFVVFIAGALLLSGCGAAPQGSPTEPPKPAIVEMSDNGWVCTNCAELIPIGADDKPLISLEEVADADE